MLLFTFLPGKHYDAIAITKKHLGHACAIIICSIFSSYIAVQFRDDERYKHSTENVEPSLGLQCSADFIHYSEHGVNASGY